MAKEVLPVNFQDDILAAGMNGKRRYNMITNSDGTVSFEDVTEYTQDGNPFGAQQVNSANQAINESVDKSVVIDDIDDIIANTTEGKVAGALAVANMYKRVSNDLYTKSNSSVIETSQGTTAEVLQMEVPSGKYLVLASLIPYGSGATLDLSMSLSGESGYSVLSGNGEARSLQSKGCNAYYILQFSGAGVISLRVYTDIQMYISGKLAAIRIGDA